MEYYPIESYKVHVWCVRVCLCMCTYMKFLSSFLILNVFPLIGGTILICVLISQSLCYYFVHMHFYFTQMVLCIKLILFPTFFH